MIPVRLTLLLLSVVTLLLIILGNPEPVAVHFLFWTETFELYKVIIASAAFGVAVALLYTSQARNLRRLRSRWK